MAGLYARKLGVRKVVVKNSRDTYMDLLGEIGLESAVSIRRVTGNTILRTVRTRSAAHQAAAIERLYRLMDGAVEALEFIVQKEDAFINRPLKSLELKKEALIAVIVRDGQVRVPFGEDSLRPGDRAVVIARGEGVSSLDQILGVPAP